MATPGSFGFSFSGGKSSGGMTGFPDTNALYKTKPRKRSSSQGQKVGGLLGAVLGFEANLLDDLKDAALGLPAGLVQTFTDPVQMAKNVAGSTWHTWSPLVKGDIGKFGHQFYDHPLAPLLDIATVFTGGAAGVGKAGGALAAGGSIARAAGKGAEGLISSESRLAKLGESVDIKYGKFQLNHDTMKWERMTGVPEYTRATSKNPLVRKFQLTREDVLNQIAGEAPKWKFSADTPLIGANKRYRRAEMRKTWHKHAAMTTQTAAMMQAAKWLSDKGVEGNAARQNILKTIHTNMVRHAERLTPDQDVAGPYTYLMDASNIKTLHDTKGVADAGFKETLEGVGRSFTTRDASKAARSADGHLLIVPKHTSEMLGLLSKEASGSITALKWMYHKPTQVWKYAVLATRPAFFVNNAVGNYFMYTMAQGGTHAFRGYVDALRQVHGDWKVAKDLSKTERWFKNMTDPNGHGWMDRNFLDQLTNSFADATYGLEGKVAAAQVAGSKLKYGLYPLTHAVADRFLRRASINALMRDSREVKKLMAEGYSFDQAANRALLENPSLRNRVSEKVNDTLGDYHTMNAGERHIRNIVPFYAWDRAIVRHGGKLLQEKPGRVAAMVRIGQGGTAATEEALGALPDFLKGVLPLGESGGKLGVPGTAGRVPIMTTQGINPYATISDLAGVASAAMGGNLNPGEALGPINPFITGTFSFLSGTDLETGRPIARRPGVPLPFDIALSEFQGLPQTRIAKQALPEQGFGWDQIRKLIGEREQGDYTRSGSSKKIDALYSKSWQEVAAAYLGIPVKQLSEPAAAKRAGEQKKRELTF